MKLPCEIIDDLLPLYEDGVCNHTTKEAVQEHLQECPRCRSRQTSYTLPEPEPVDDIREAAAAKKSFQKVKRVWIISLAAVLAVALLLGGFIQMYIYAHLPRDYTECLAQGEEFIRHLQDGEFEEAIVMVPLRYESEQWLSYHRQEFVDAMEDCRDQGIRVLSYDKFEGYELASNSTGNPDPQYFEGRSRYVHYYLYRVTLQTASGETLPAVIRIAFQNGKLFQLRLDCALTPETQMLKDALAHTELTN